MVERAENDHRLPVCVRSLLVWSVIIMSFMGWTSIAQQAKAAVYWGNSTAVGAVDFDRTAMEFAYWPWPPNELPASSVFGEISDVAVNSKYLFWINSAGAIQRVNLEGPTVNDVIVSGISNPCGLTATESEVYWTSCTDPMGRNTIGRAKVDGSTPTTLVRKLFRPCDVAVDNQHIYWTDLEGIARANLDGSEAVAGFVPAMGGPCGGLTVTDQYIYWGDRGRAIGRSSIDGEEVNDRFISTAGAVTGLAADSTSIFWINDYEGGGRPATIGRADIGGAGADQAWVTNNRSNPRGLAVDIRSGLAPLPPPAREIRFGKVRHDRRTGSIFLDVWAWEGGEVTVVAPQIGWKIVGSSSRAFENGVLRQRLKLWPGKSVRGYSLRQRLKSKGRAKVVLWVRYEEADTAPIFKRKRLTFSRKPTS